MKYFHLLRILTPFKNSVIGWWGGPQGKGIWCQSDGLNLNMHQNGRELTSKNCPLTFPHVPWKAAFTRTKKSLTLMYCIDVLLSSVYPLTLLCMSFHCRIVVNYVEVGVCNFISPLFDLENLFLKERKIMLFQSFVYIFPILSLIPVGCSLAVDVNFTVQKCLHCVIRAPVMFSMVWGPRGGSSGRVGHSWGSWGLRTLMISAQGNGQPGQLEQWAFQSREDSPQVNLIQC